MGLYYQTEYRLGRRGGRVCRSYTGLRAFLAIAIDLFFVLTFDLAFGLLFFVVRHTLKLITIGLFVLTLPFRLARWISDRLGRRSPPAYQVPGASAPFKPAWPAYDEV